MIKTWQQRCEEHPDHNGIVTNRMIQARMQEEIDELRAALEQAQAGIETLHAMYKQACQQRDQLMDQQRAQVAAIRGRVQ